MEFTMNEHGFQSEFDFGTLNVSSNENFGFRPYALLVSSVAVCSGLTLRKILEKMRIPFTDLKITADVKCNEEEANRVEEIALKFIITGTNIPERQVEKALALTKKNCSMVQSVKDSIRIMETYEINEKG